MGSATTCLLSSTAFLDDINDVIHRSFGLPYFISPVTNLDAPSSWEDFYDEASKELRVLRSFESIKECPEFMSPSSGYLHAKIGSDKNTVSVFQISGYSNQETHGNYYLSFSTRAEFQSLALRLVSIFGGSAVLDDCQSFYSENPYVVSVEDSTFPKIKDYDSYETYQKARLEFLKAVPTLDYPTINYLLSNVDEECLDSDELRKHKNQVPFVKLEEYREYHRKMPELSSGFAWVKDCYWRARVEEKISNSVSASTPPSKPGPRF